MEHHFLTTFTMVLCLAGCKADKLKPAPAPGEIATEIAGSESVFVTRNFPNTPLGELKRMSPDLQLGRAYASEASDRWLKMVRQLRPESSVNTLPVLFAKSFVFSDGKPRLAVGQLQCTMTGDGSFSPSSVFSCALYTIDVSTPAKPVILWEGLSALGTLQNSQIVRVGEGGDSLNEATVIEEEIRAAEQVVRTSLIFRPSNGHSISLERKAVK